MQIDWFTTIAQIINFLVLVALLKHFLYGPIVHAMDERESRIASRLAEAEQKNTDAGQLLEQHRLKNEELEKQKNHMLAQAQKDADALRKDLINQARSEVDEIQSKWKEALQREKTDFINEIRKRAWKETCTIARKALNDLTGADLESLALNIFLKRIQSLKASEKEALITSLRKANGEMLFRSSFDIPAKTRNLISKSMSSLFSNQLQLQYETNPGLICGIEIIVQDQKIAWNLDQYIKDLEEVLLHKLESQIAKVSDERRT